MLIINEFNCFSKMIKILKNIKKNFLLKIFYENKLIKIYIIKKKITTKSMSFLF